MRKARKADDALVLALARGLSTDQAAKQAGVSLATAYRRLADPAFQARAKELRHETLTRAAAMLTAAGVESVRTPADLLKPANAPAVRLGAARSILDLGVNAVARRTRGPAARRRDRVKQSPPGEAPGRGVYP